MEPGTAEAASADVRADSMPGFADLLAGGQIAGARPYQEDDFRVTGFRGGDADRCDLLMVLADGMGGHRGGAEASRLAVSVFVDTFRPATGGVAARLRAALDAANAAVGESAAANPRYAGMGCTLVGCAVTAGGAAHWISVGDSPLWRLRAGGTGDAARLDRLNDDHSLRPVFEKLVSTGEMRREDIDAEGAHQLRSAVTGDELALVDAGAAPVSLDVGDRIVLASDGLETLPEAEIARLGAGFGTPTEAVSGLLAAVVAAGRPSQDNATAVVYRHAEKAAVRRRFERLAAATRPSRRRR